MCEALCSCQWLKHRKNLGEALRQPSSQPLLRPQADQLSSWRPHPNWTKPQTALKQDCSCSPGCGSRWLHGLCLAELPRYRDHEPGTTMRLLGAQSTAGPGVNTERKWAKAIKICNSPLISALCPMVGVYCKLKRITSEACVCASFSKQGEGFLQKGEIPLSRTDFLL